MKKISIALLMLLCCGSLILAGCVNGQDEPEPVFETTKILADFESEEELFQHNYVNSLGRVELNTDPKYIAHGNGSAKLDIHGKDLNFPPYVKIYAESPLLNMPDITQVTQFSFDVFNASETDELVKFRIKFRTNYSPFVTTVVEKGARQTITVPMDRGAYSNVYKLNETEWFEIVFSQNEETEEDIVTVYLDNFRATMTQDEISPAVIRTGDNLIDITQGNLVYLEPSYTLNLSLNTDPNYIYSGEASYRLCDYGITDEGGNAAWPKFTFSDAFGSLDISDYQYLNVMIYNDSNYDVDLYTLVDVKLGTADMKSWTMLQIPIHAPKEVAENENHPDRNKYLSTMKDSFGSSYSLEKFARFVLMHVNSPLREMTLYLDSITLSKEEPLAPPEFDWVSECNGSYEIPMPEGYDRVEVNVSSPSGQILHPSGNRIDCDEIGQYTFNYVYEKDGKIGTASYKATCFGQSKENGNLDHCDDELFMRRFWTTSADASLTFDDNRAFAGKGSYLFRADAVPGEVCQGWDGITAAWPTLYLNAFLNADLRDFDAIGMWVYNDSAQDVDLWLSGQTPDVKLKKLFRGMWNYVTIPVSVLRQAVDGNGNSVHDVSSMKTLQLMNTRPVGLDLRLYFDEISVFRAEERDGKLYDFEQESDLREVGLRTEGASLALRADEGTFRGTQSLKLSSKRTAESDGQFVSEFVIHNRRLALAEHQSIEFELYNPSDQEIHIFLTRSYFGNSFVVTVKKGWNRIVIRPSHFAAFSEDKFEMNGYHLENLSDIELLLVSSSAFDCYIDEIEIKDSFAPPVIGLERTFAEAEIGEIVTLPSATVTDDFDEDIKAEIFFKGALFSQTTFIPEEKGEYVFTYRVKDSYGNITEENFVIYVEVNVFPHREGSIATFDDARGTANVQGQDGATIGYSETFRRGETGGSLSVTGEVGSVFVLTPFSKTIPEDATHIVFWMYSRDTETGTGDIFLFLSNSGFPNYHIGTYGHGEWKQVKVDLEAAKKANALIVNEQNELLNLRVTLATNSGTGLIEVYFDDFTYHREDNAPVVGLERTFAEAKIGETVTLPSATVTDDFDEDIKAEVFLNGALFSQTTFVPERAGEYVFIYRAEDSSGNITEEVFTVYVGMSAQPHDPGSVATFNNRSSLDSAVKGTVNTSVNVSDTIRRGDSGFSLKLSGPAADTSVILTPFTAAIPEGATHIGFWAKGNSQGENVSETMIFLAVANVGNYHIGTVRNGDWTYLALDLEDASSKGFLVPDENGRIPSFTLLTNTNMGTGTVELYLDDFTYRTKVVRQYLYGEDAPTDGIVLETDGLDYHFSEGEGNRIWFTGNTESFSVVFDVDNYAVFESMTLDMWQSTPTQLYIGDGGEEYAKFADLGSFYSQWNTDPSLNIVIKAQEQHVTAAGEDASDGKIRIALKFPSGAGNVFLKNITFAYYV